VLWGCPSFYVVLSVLTTLGIGGGIYLYSFAVRLGQCLS
jgi:hypothetical protein